jgi:hypothetical protein
MGLGLTVRAKFEGDDGAFRQRLLAWADGRNFEAHADPELIQPVLVKLHPAAEELYLYVERGSVKAEAKTSTVGPGYHAWLCDLLRALGDDVGLRWAPPGDEEFDETGYFHSRDRRALEEEMLAWLGGLAKAVRRDIADHAPESVLTVNLPIGTSFESSLPVVTPVGPRDLAWFDRVAADARQGIDLFPWWEPGPGAEMLLGRAVTQMWTDVRWREPITDAETDLLDDVLSDLGEAHGIDPGRNYPWREWLELARAHGIEDELPPEVAQNAKTATGPLIGYRRQNVTHQHSSWSLRAPGSFAEEWDDGTHILWEGTRTIRMTTFRVEGPPNPNLDLDSDGKPSGERFERNEGELRGVAWLTREVDDGEPYWMLNATLQKPGGLAIVTTCFHDEADKEWALGVWRSVR